MGLYDRDYMRKGRDDPPPDESAGERLEAGLQSTWQRGRSRKALIAIGLCLLVLIAAAVLNAILRG